MMQNSLVIAYLVVVLTCGVYYYRRKRSDALLVGFLASCLYFLPAMFGTVQFPYGGDSGLYTSSIVPGAYGAMLLVIGTLVAVTVGYDRMFRVSGRTLSLYEGLLPEVLLGITLVGVVASIMTVGKGYLCIEKQDMLDHINGWYYIASYAAPFALVSAVAARKWWIVTLSLVALLADMFIGFRASTSVAIVALCLAFGQALFEGTRKRNAFIAVALAAGAGLFIVKQLAWNIKYTVSIDCSAARAAAPLPPALPVKPALPNAPLSTNAASTPGATTPPTASKREASPSASTKVAAAHRAARAAKHSARAPSPESKPVVAIAPASTPAPRPSVASATTAPQAPAAVVDPLQHASVQFHLSNLEYTAKLLSSLNIYVDALRYSEPMVTQSILNEVVKRGFKTTGSSVFDQALSGVPGGKSIFGIDVSKVESFNSQFQPVLFAKSTFGMANNPWAQAFAAGGFALVIGFALIYSLGLAFLSAVASRVSPILGAVPAVLAGWWGFFAHRNDVLTQVGIMKTTLYVAIAALAINLVCGGLTKLRWFPRFQHR